MEDDDHDYYYYYFLLIFFRNHVQKCSNYVIDWGMEAKAHTSLHTLAVNR
jgi:hypothetical protein